jgi:hypothetical protein
MQTGCAHSLKLMSKRSTPSQMSLTLILVCTHLVHAIVFNQFLPIGPIDLVVVTDSEAILGELSPKSHLSEC